MAMIFKPKLLLADEPTSALDVTTQAQIIKQLMEIRKEYNVAIILVTHNLGVAANVSDKIIVMRQGKIVEAGSNEMIINKPQVEYTKQLLKSVPVIGGLCYYENDEVILEINHLTKEFPLASGETLTACNDINLRVYQGKTLGIIGESGCGKAHWCVPYYVFILLLAVK